MTFKIYYFLPFVFILMMFDTLDGQSNDQFLSFADSIHNHWHYVKEEKLQHKFFREKDITTLLKSYESLSMIHFDTLGFSVEGRPIHIIKFGQGDIPVAMWTQMHGNEPTATMAVMDMLRFFADDDPFLSEWKSNIYQRISLYIIPMLNPDGAEVFKRRNALDIDLNRDALRLESPESQLLKMVIDSIRPRFGFNLHDQSDYYTAGDVDIPATIAFLAPAYDEDKSINDSRANAMRLIVQLNEIVQQYLPGAVGRFSDTFEPRAFGDNIQKWGTSTILIESGAYKGDLHKQTQRQLHFTMLLAALQSIASKSYLIEGLRPYEDIPYNNRRGHDLIVRNLDLIVSGDTIRLDVAYQKDEVRIEQPPHYFQRFFISDMGDLSTMYGFIEVDAEGWTYSSGKLLKDKWKSLLDMNIAAIIQQGYSHVLVKRLPPEHKIQGLPLQFLLHERDFNNDIKMGLNPGIILTHDGDNRRVFINNGQFLNLAEDDIQHLEKLTIADLFD